MAPVTPWASSMSTCSKRSSAMWISPSRREPPPWTTAAQGHVSAGALQQVATMHSATLPAATSHSLKNSSTAAIG